MSNEPKYPWVDPDLLPKDSISFDDRYIFVKDESTHKSLAFMRPIHSTDAEHVDGKDWELFHTSHKATIDGVEFFYGMYVEGIGAFHVMVAVENSREPTDNEREIFSKKSYSMYGSHSGKLAYTMPPLKI